MSWISVKDKLPTGVWGIGYENWSEEVLIANTACVDIGFYNRVNEEWNVNGEWIDKITHWMPLPSNPND